MADKPIIGLVAKPTQENALKLAKKIIAWLDERSLDYRVDKQVGEQIGMSEKVVRRKEMTSIANPVVVLGGDGTFISVSRHPSETKPIIIGVNMGSLGFLTEIQESEVFTVLEKTLAGKIDTSERFLLEASHYREGKLLGTYSVMNDVVITKEALARIFGIEIEVDGSKAATIKGDGIIIATPGGSTAYSLAAGGSIVHPRVNSLLLTPISPHSLSSRPIVLPGDSSISLKLGPQLAENESIYLTIDGQDGTSVIPGDVVKVTTSKDSFRVAQSENRSYFDILGEKLGWAAGRASAASRASAGGPSVGFEGKFKLVCKLTVKRQYVRDT